MRRRPHCSENGAGAAVPASPEHIGVSAGEAPPGGAAAVALLLRVRARGGARLGVGRPCVCPLQRVASG